MFAKGVILGVITGQPLIENVPSMFNERRMKIKFSVSCYRKKYMQKLAVKDTFDFICWGGVQGVDFSTLKDGDLVYVEFQMIKREFQLESGEIRTATNYVVKNLQKLDYCDSIVEKFMESSQEVNPLEKPPVDTEILNLYDGEKTAVVEEKKEETETAGEQKEEEITMEDIF